MEQHPIVGATRRGLLAWLGAAVALSPVVALAQAAGKRPLIGALTSVGEAATPRVSAFLEGMHALGYVEGRDFAITYQHTDMDYAKLPALAEALVRMKPDIIIAFGPPDAVADKKATSTIPIVASLLPAESVQMGLIASVARPGGNLTGIMNRLPGLSGKQVEIATEVIPAARRIGLLVNPTNPTATAQRQEIEAAGATKGIAIIAAEAHARADLDHAFAALTSSKVEAVIVLRDGMFLNERVHIAELAAGAGLPSVFSQPEHVEAGGLVSYGIDPVANDRRAAYYVDRILKGAAPADLPVEFPTKLEMAINLKTAKALGLTLPQSLLIQADKEFE